MLACSQLGRLWRHLFVAFEIQKARPRLSALSRPSINKTQVGISKDSILRSDFNTRLFFSRCSKNHPQQQQQTRNKSPIIKMVKPDMADEIADKFQDTALEGGGGRGRGGHKSRGGRRGGGRDSDLSRALSRLLRHQAANAGIRLDSEGYAPLDSVVRFFSFSLLPRKGLLVETSLCLDFPSMFLR